MTLSLDRMLGKVGTPVVVGSAALGLMVWRDLDITVICDVLSRDAVLSVAGDLGRHPAVREVRFRDDTGAWNQDDRYPDGLYVGVDCVDGLAHRWNIDIWFVDEPERQPDLLHLSLLGPRLSEEVRGAILSIKSRLHQGAGYGSSVTSYDIYEAVLDHDVRTLTEFEAHHNRVNDPH